LLLPHGLGQAGQVVQISRVGLHARDVVADGGDRFVQSGLVSSGDEHVGAFGDEQLGRR
jgi:hypothetical protein